MRPLTLAWLLLAATSLTSGARTATPAPALQLSTQSFDHDPGWDGHNNRLPVKETRQIRQDFGYSRTSHTSETAGEVGGLIYPAAEPASYGQPFGPKSLEQPFSASGTLVVEKGGGNSLFGFYNASTLNEWRTPSTLVFRINGRGEGFHAHVEYCTARWRAGGDFFAEPGPGKRTARLISNGPTRHPWSLRYDPKGNNGAGTITATLDGETLVMNLDPEHKADGALFNRFGLLNVMKSADDGGTLWLGNLKLDGVPIPLDRDPQWEAFGNRNAFGTRNVRPWFDFGFSPTRYAGGSKVGEMGGLIFRGDERYPERLAYYGDRVGALSLDQPLKASGKICQTRGVTDSSVLIGFFHSTGSIRQSDAQKSGFPENFLGVAIEGPSREGFLFYPVCSTNEEGTSTNGAAATGPNAPPHLMPDSKPHTWSLDYSPAANTITVTLDGQRTVLNVPAEHRTQGAQFDRFGIVTTHIDGNGQEVYLDDLSYTSAR